MHSVPRLWRDAPSMIRCGLHLPLRVELIILPLQDNAAMHKAVDSAAMSDIRIGKLTGALLLRLNASLDRRRAACISFVKLQQFDAEFLYDRKPVLIII